jgi:succinyl-CoA synthetase beta subunit
MNLHEYQSKQLLQKAGIRIPSGVIVSNISELHDRLSELDCERYVVKAQVHSGSRKAANGVFVDVNNDDVDHIAKDMLGSSITTRQSSTSKQTINHILIEEYIDFKQSYYISLAVDFSEQSIVLIAAKHSEDIEHTSKDNSTSVLKQSINTVSGISAAQYKKLYDFLDIENDGLTSDIKSIIEKMYALLIECDLTLIETNPMVVNESDQYVCLDAKIQVDDNALYRQTNLTNMFDWKQLSNQELLANQYGVSYVPLNGNVGCIANGAGLALATIDILKNSGVQPANFMDLTGEVTIDKVSNATKLILSSHNIKLVFINLFGGIVGCDVVVKGIIKAIEDTDTKVPILARFSGNNAKIATEIAKQSGKNIDTVTNLKDAMRKLAELAK